MPASTYQLKYALPFAVLAVRCDESHIHAVEYLPRGKALPPQNLLAAECAKQLDAYCRKPRGHRFDVPLLPARTPHQRRVREVVAGLRGGQTMTYGEVAAQLGNTSPRAIGGACRANAVPLFVPCHRIVAACGIGGFMGSAGDFTPIKTKLLQMEGVM